MLNKKLLPISKDLVEEVKDINDSDKLRSNRNSNAIFKVIFCCGKV